MPLGAGAERAAGTGRAGVVVEAHPNDRLAIVVAGLGQVRLVADPRPVPFGAVARLLVPLA
jgi:hypothetical protein